MNKVDEVMQNFTEFIARRRGANERTFVGMAMHFKEILTDTGLADLLRAVVLCDEGFQPEDEECGSLDLFAIQELRAAWAKLTASTEQKATQP